MIQEVSLNITGMTCGHCQKAVEEEILEVEGVLACEVDWTSASAKVSYDSDKTTIDTIFKAVNSMEVYHAEIAK